MANKFLDLAGLQRLVNKIKALIPTKTSELNNDKGFITIEDIPGGETQITIRHQERFIVETSSVFEFTKGYYTLNANSVDWYLDGIKQSNDTLIETDNRTIEVVGGLPQGSTVVFDYVEYTNTVIGLEGVGVEYQWNGTELGVKREDEVNYQYQDLEGPEGEQGPRGLPGTTSWNGITDKPSSFSPSTHTHTKSQVGLGSVDNIKQATKAEFDSHNIDTTKHINNTERAAWNAKETTTGSQNKANQAEQNAKDYTDGKVLTDVPLNAKFTDTVYSHPSTHPASMITDLPTSLPANGGNADTVNGKTVAENVPSGAKFTDTTYSEITTAEIDTGTSSTLRTITGRRIKHILDKVQGWINNLTKADVGLGNVDNIQQATKAEFNTHNNDTTRHITSAERTSWNAKETPASAQIKANTAESNAKSYADTHINSTSNPHGVTKSQVSLGSVLNYGIATQAEAEAGTSNVKYMTPQRTKQAIDKFKPTKLSELVNDIGAGAGLNIVTSATEPTLNVGDQWHKEI